MEPARIAEQVAATLRDLPEDPLQREKRLQEVLQTVGVDLMGGVADLRRETVTALWKENGGKGTAELLGIGRTTLYKILELKPS